MTELTTRRRRPEVLIAVAAACALGWIPHAEGGAGAADGDESCCACHGLAWSLPSERKVNVPPEPSVDFIHMKLDLRIDDMSNPVVIADQTLTFTTTAETTSTIALDARLLAIESVLVEASDGKRASTFQHDGRKLLVTVESPLPKGESGTLRISYRVEDPPLGLIWSPAEEGFAAEVHTQGQPETNSYWFPCHDFPNEKLTTEVRVTVPGGYLALSNGKLIEKSNRVVPFESADGGSELRPFEVFHWLQDAPHVNYLVSLVVGKFDVVDVGTPALSMPVYVPPGRGGDVPGTYGRTAEMVAVFERVFDEPYPWSKYAQAVVRNFGAGGMENTSATTLFDTAVIEPGSLDDFDLEGLISHELGHQWFGDLVTCTSWEHIWINEGFATYSTALWYENRTPALGEEAGRSGPDAYDRQIQNAFDGIIANDSVGTPDAVGMVSSVYAHPWETFRRPANPYGKGASILHMLRSKLGDQAFFGGVGLFIDRFKFKNATTDDLRQAMEESSGSSLTEFFEQWCRRPGVPHVEIDVAWNPDRRVVTLTGKQTQPIDASNPAFVFDLPIWIEGTGESAGFRGTLSFNSDKATLEVPCGQDPAMVAVDPELTTLAKITVRQSRDRWLTQLAAGPSLGARVQAARALSSDESESSANALRRVAVTRSLPATVRVEAVRSLRDRMLLADLIAMVGGAMDNWMVRAEACEGIATVAADPDAKVSAWRYDAAVRTLVQAAKGDESLKVRAAAIRGLSKLKTPAGQALSMDALNLDSQDDVLRIAAIDALAASGEASSLGVLIERAKTEARSRTRAAAAAAVGRLGSVDREAAFAALSELLDDDVLRVRRAAGEGLVELRDPRGIDRLTAFIEANAAEELRASAAEWRRQLQERLDAAASK